MSTSRSSGHAVLIVVIVVLVVAILGVVGWIFWQNFINKPATNANAVTTFEQCKAAPGSILQETYPETCRTTDGKSFTGPVSGAENGALMLTYCAPAEKLCFEYPDTWTIKQLSSSNSEPGAQTDHLEVRAPNDALVFVLESGIGGLGGTCEDEYKFDVSVLMPTPAASMSGFAGENSIDTLQVARVVYPKDDKFAATLYISDQVEYTTPGSIRACGLGFSEFITGRNAILSSEFEGAGVFTFGYNGQAGAALYDSRADAEAAYDTDLYKEGAAILASLHYQ